MILRTFAVFVVLGCSSSVRGDFFLVHQGGDTWKQRNFATVDEIPANKLILRIAVDIGTPDPDTPDNPPPQPGSITQQVTTITSETITKKTEHVVLAAVLRAIAESERPPAELKLALKSAIDRLADNPALPGNKFQEWHRRVSALARGDFTRAFVRQVRDGVNAASPATSFVASTLYDAATGDKTAVGKLLDVESGSKTAKSVAVVLAEGLTLGEILQLIRDILQFLRDIGIFGADAFKITSLVLGGVLLC